MKKKVKKVRIIDKSITVDEFIYEIRKIDTEVIKIIIEKEELLKLLESWRKR